MRRLPFLLIALLLVLGPARAATGDPPPGSAATPTDPARAAVLELARRGWVYDLRTSMMRRPRGLPEIEISARSMTGAHICIAGEAPHPLTRQVLAAFGALVARTFGTPLRIDRTGPDSTDCDGEPVMLRLFSTVPPNRAFNDDLRRMDAAFHIGLPRRRLVIVTSPAQAQTFFGTAGQATHLLVMQPAPGAVPTELERRFFTSILVEELYQAFTFGMDILLFDPEMQMMSKLQEHPVNLRNLSWTSERFMEGLLATSPAGLCRFDILMMHALGRSDLDRTNSDALIDYLDAHFDALSRAAAATMALPDVAPILDPACAGDAR